MKNKTCGECKFYDLHGGCNKIKDVLWLHSTNIACIGFDPKNPTNGDKIRQMSDEELAETLVYCEQPEYQYSCASWRSVVLGSTSYARKSEAIDATIEKLKEVVNECG